LACLQLRIVQGPADAPIIDWLGTADRTADDLIRRGRQPGEAVTVAVSFLRKQLAQGPCLRQKLLEEGEQAGISLRTLERAKAELRVVSEQRRELGRNVWYWRLAAERRK
jgi:hypothetical protein